MFCLHAIVDHVLWAYLIPRPSLVGATAEPILEAEGVIRDPSSAAHFLVTVPPGSQGKTVRARLPAAKEGDEEASVDFVVPVLPVGVRQIRISAPRPPPPAI